MSGPLANDDALLATPQDVPSASALEILEGRETDVGGFPVRRVLPRRPRRSVGAWCFVDHMGPRPVAEGAGLDIGPHPHMGLQTVTWLVEGAVLHRDSLGSEQPIHPGQLNLMTAGHGVSHSEETTGVYSGPLHGVQLWVAQPAATRDGPPAFEHHASLPRLELAGGGMATVLLGGFDGEMSPARHDTDHMGVELDLGRGPTVLPLERAFEHAMVALDGVLTVETRPLGPGRLGYLGVGRDQVVLETDGRTRVLLIGGTPFPEPLFMWWNYVARTPEEIVSAHREWSNATDRFGPVASPLPRMDTPEPAWAHQAR